MSKTTSRAFTDTSGMTRSQIREEIELVKSLLGWHSTEGSARRWWQAFENENEQRLPLVLRLAEELALRQATIVEFFWAYLYSETDNIQSNLDFYDFVMQEMEPEQELTQENFKNVVQ